MEQMKYVDDSGLLNELEEIRVRCLTQDDVRNQIFRNLCQSYSNKFRIEFVKNIFDNDHDMIYHRDSAYACSEDITLKMMFDDAQNEDKNIVYFHSKGTTAFFNHMNPVNVHRFREYYYWRNFMNWGVLERWRDCVAALETHDTAGCDYHVNPLPHYSGNFWWTKSSHIRKLPDPSNKTWWNELKTKKEETANMATRMGDEMWLCSLIDTKSYDIVNIPSEYRMLHACLRKDQYEGMLK